MKSIVITSLVGIFVFSQFTFSQSQNWWRIDGNNASGNHFIGTTNNQGLNFRTNNQNRLQILPNGQLRFNSFALGNTGLLTYDATGLLTPLAFDGNGDMVLSNNGSFVPVSSLSNWNLNGNFLYTQNHFVGIGTSTPTAPLTVAGDALFTGSITTSGLNVLQKIEADTIKGVIRVDVNGNLMLGEEDGYNGITSRQEDLRINSRPGYDHNVVINANTNGNLGIGVVNPQEKFDLFGNARLTGDVIFSSYADPGISEDKFIVVDENGKTSAKNLENIQQLIYSKFCDLSDPNAVINNPTWSNGPNKIFVECPQVYVGIGTNEPTSPLDVRGLTKAHRIHAGHSISNNSAILSGYRTGTANPALSIVRFGRHLNSVDYDYFDLRMDGTLRMRNQTRDVFLVNIQEESVYARRVVVDEDQWPDYVFESNYSLMPLPQLREFIATNGHLPNVPAAAVVEESGVDLGEMAKITMEKVEELTLYILQQQELLESQQEVLKLQQEEIERLKEALKK
jgi:hypothetical protein